MSSESIHHQQPASLPGVAPPPILYRDVPMNVTCPHCQQHITTHVKPIAGLLSWVLTICFIGVCCAGCFFPLWHEGCQDVEHYCPQCSTLLGRYKRIGA